jgi:hypothetical protein
MPSIAFNGILKVLLIFIVPVVSQIAIVAYYGLYPSTDVLSDFTEELTLLAIVVSVLFIFSVTWIPLFLRAFLSALFVPTMWITCVAARWISCAIMFDVCK